MSSSVVLVEAPKPLVSLAEAKKWLNVEFDEDDAVILGAIKAVHAEIDGPGGWMGISLGLQTLEQREIRFRPRIRLEYPPVRSVLSVEYVTSGGLAAMLEAPAYRLEDRWLVLAAQPSARSGSILIRYVAGYPTTGSGADERSQIPEDVRQAVLRKVARLYEHRGDGLPANLQDDPIADVLLSAHQDWSFP